MTLRFVVLVVALATFSSSLPAQETATPSPIPAATPTGITDPETATRAWLDTMPPNEKARSDAYFEGTYWLILWNFLLTVAIALFILPIVFAILYSIFRVAQRTWWIWGTIVGIILTTFLNMAAPVFIEPIFNQYTPLTDPKVRDPILALARANEIPGQQVFVVDQSRQTKRVSANVSGLAGTTRIALNDNLLNQCTLAEIREVMAHEMGHYVLNHGAKMTMSIGIFIFVGFGLAAATFNRVVKKRGASWGVNGIADPAGFPLLMLIFATYAFLLTPIANTMSQTIEREADIFGLNAAG